MTPIGQDHTSILRRAEFETIANLVEGAGLVLEVGGGNGFQRLLLEGVAGRVVSIDIKPHPDPVADVLIYDGHNIPLGDGKADCIFSSNVLEHIADLDRSLNEMRRSLSDHGIAIHILPTSSWRIWTTFTHYVALPKILLSKLNELGRMHAPTENSQATEITNSESSSPVQKTFFKWKWVASTLMSPRHGERGNRLSEVFYFRNRWWLQKFEDTGWEAVDSFPTGIFYSGNVVLGKTLPLSVRKLLSKIFGSSSRVYVLKKVARS